MDTDAIPPVPNGAGTIDGWLSQEDLGTRWKVSKQTIRRLRKSGKLPSFQITGALYRFKLTDILRIESEGVMLPAISNHRLKLSKKKTAG